MVAFVRSVKEERREIEVKQKGVKETEVSEGEKVKLKRSEIVVKNRKK